MKRQLPASAGSRPALLEAGGFRVPPSHPQSPSACLTRQGLCASCPQPVDAVAQNRRALVRFLSCVALQNFGTIPR